MDQRTPLVDIALLPHVIMAGYSQGICSNGRGKVMNTIVAILLTSAVRLTENNFDLVHLDSRMKIDFDSIR